MSRDHSQPRRTPSQQHLFVALDGEDPEHLLARAQRLSEHVAGFKLGLSTVFAEHGPRLLDAISTLENPLFLDYKLYDIPTTAAYAARALARFTPALVTVHGTVPIVRAVRQALPAASKLLAVTMLTCLDDAELAQERQTERQTEHHDAHVNDLPQENRLETVMAQLGIAPESRTMARYICVRAQAAIAAGANGVVTPAFALSLLRSQLPANTVLVCPGVSIAGETRDDQKQTTTAAQAIASGADVLVVGRLLTQSSTPEAILEQINQSITAQTKHNG